MRIPGSLIYQGFRRGLRNPKVRPWLMLGIFVYLISPIDLLPSFFIGAGEIDDLVLLGLLLGEMVQIWLGDPIAPEEQMNDPQPSAQPRQAQPHSDRPASEVVIDVQAYGEPD